jgi:predicted SAM-dependent methyltransferase
MKLHIGGEQIKEGWKILNIQKKDGVDFIGDISDLSQFEDNSIEEIYASHVFEHVLQKNIKSTLIGIHRVIQDNGKFYVSVPDMNVLCKIFLEPKAPSKVKVHVLRMMFGGQMDDFDIHYFGWDFNLLKEFLLSAGFKKAEKVKSFSLFDDTSDFAPYSGVPISLNVIAYK